jgi:hypothetical protein
VAGALSKTKGSIVATEPASQGRFRPAPRSEVESGAPGSDLAIEIGPNDITFGVIPSLQAHVGHGEYVGKIQAVGDPAYPIAVAQYFGHLETLAPVTEEAITYANLRARFQRGWGFVRCLD